jgi:SAM-dependent methyltransferase
MARLQPTRGGKCSALQCQRCGFVWAHPLPDMNAEFLNQIYGQEYTDELRALERDERGYQVLYRAAMHQMDKVESMLNGAVGHALNVGAMTLANRVLVDRGWDLTVVEVSRYAAQSAREYWSFDVLEAKIEEVVLFRDYFEFVKLGHVIEHLADPMPVLRKLWSALKPEGLLLVETDNAGGLKTWIETTARRLLGEDLTAKMVYKLTGKDLCRRYGRLLPYEHICLFRRQTLILALIMAGFDVVETLCPAQGDPAWFPFTNQPENWSPLEKAMVKVDQLGARLGAGEVLVAFGRKPKSFG